MLTRRQRQQVSEENGHIDDSHEEYSGEAESVSLEMVFHQLKLYRKELLDKIDQSKEEIFILVQNENNSLREEIKLMKCELEEKDKVISKLKTELETVKSEAEEKVDINEFVDVERDVAIMQQYSRRNNVEICGIPDSVDISVLENKVISIAKEINVNVSASDFEACHRLYKKRNDEGPAKVIARFTNRKVCESLLLNSKLLKSKKTELRDKHGLENSIFINNNLCNYYKYLWGKSKALYKKKLIKEFRTSITGNIKIKLLDDSVKMITHIRDLQDLFPDDI